MVPALTLSRLALEAEQQHGERRVTQARQSMQAELYGYTAGSLTTILLALLTMAVDAGGAMYDPTMTLCMV